MKPKLYAFIDSYQIISILIEHEPLKRNKEFYITDKKNKTRLEILDCYDEYEFCKYVVKFIPSINLNKDYYIVDEEGNKCHLQSGSIVRTKEFEDNFKYDGPLGVEYHNDYSIFRIWSPVAKEIKIKLFKGDNIRTLSLYPTEKGCWEIKVSEDLDSFGYIYYVRTFEKFSQILDPYGISSNANAKFNYVIDKSKLYKMKYDRPPFSGIATDSIIYEASIKDFTCDLKSDLNGTFLGLLENNETKEGPTGIKYIKSLGVTHLQLLPTFDFEGVDDIKKELKYNWGYNPLQYFVPCGWYSKNPDDPYSRLNELLEMIDGIHKEGIRVVFDVVYNHVFKCENFACSELVPGYFYRYEDDGRLSNASGCGNVLATERYMVSKFVVDNLKYWADLFKVSGFRFDLMGLLDIKTLNTARLELIKIEKNMILYGEGWNMSNPLPDHDRPHMYNHGKLMRYGFFNDKFRDHIRGSEWNNTPGFAFKDEKNIYDLNNLIMGSCINYYKFSEPTQTINYVECHDNLTFFDYAKNVVKFNDHDAMIASKIALSIVLISQGVPFIHAGQEFFRTKKGDSNSYKSNKNINKIDYSRRDLYIDNVNMVKELISIRKVYKEFRYSSSDDIENKIHILDGIINGHRTGLVYEGDKYDLFVFVKNDIAPFEIKLSSTYIFNGEKRVEEKGRSFTITTPGVHIFRKDKDYEDNWQG